VEKIFQGKFYNGLSSFAYEASILLEEHAILIAYNDKEEQEQTVVWDINQMQKNEFIDKANVTLIYGVFPPQSLEVHSAEFVSEIKSKYAKAPFMQSNYHFLANKGLKGVLIGGSACLGLLLLFYFFGIPTVAESIATKFPIQYEEQLGEQMFEALIKNYEVDSAKSTLVNDFYKKLNYPSNYNIKITVVQENMVNAFAVPGGNIVVFDGILEKMRSSEQLAALLAHEASHIELKHSTKSIFRSLGNYLFISLIFYDINAIASILIDNANMLNNLSYSRSLEEEADQNGLRLMMGQKIDPQGMIGLFELLKDVQDTEATDEKKQAKKDLEEEEEPNEFMSTHPLINNRIKYIKDIIEKDKNKYTAKEDLDITWQAIREKLNESEDANKEQKDEDDQ
jgi:Zn-dependent protease with chaperone function